MRNKLPIALSLAALVVALLGAVPVAQSHGVLHAIFAHRAGAVDGKSAVGPGATLNRAAGKLVATKARGTDRGKFLKKFIPKVDSAFNADNAANATNAGALDGLDSTAFARGDNVLSAGTSSGPTVDATDATATAVLQLDVTTPEICPGVDSHRYLVQASGLDFEETGTSFARHSLTVDSTSLGVDDTFRGENLDALAYARANYGMEKIYTVDAGAHSFRLMADAGSGEYQAGRATMVVMDLGNSCA